MSKKDTDKVRALIQNAKRGEKIVSLNLRGDVQLEIEALEQELAELRDAPDLPALGEVPKKVELAKRIKALIDEVEQDTIKVRLRALPRRQWADLVAKYPAKTDDVLFDLAIYNEAVPACWVEPDIDDETRDKLLEEITQGQWDQLVDTVSWLNRGDQRVPFSALASRVLQTSGETSNSPAPSA